MEWLYGICLRAYGDMLGGEAGVADLVADTFRAAYENARKFDPAGITDCGRVRLRVRAWLGWIAKHLLQELLRGRTRLPARTLELEHWGQVAKPDRPAHTPSQREELVRQAVFALTEREQLVIRTTFQWYDRTKQHQRLPNAVAAELAQAMGTTPENLRQIRRRALRKIEDYLREHAPDAEIGARPDG